MKRDQATHRIAQQLQAVRFIPFSVRLHTGHRQLPVDIPDLSSCSRYQGPYSYFFSPVQPFSNPDTHLPAPPRPPPQPEPTRTNHFNTFISYLPNPTHLVIPPRGIGHYPPDNCKFLCRQEELHRVHFGCRHWVEEKMEVTGWKVAEVNLVQPPNCSPFPGIATPEVIVP